MITYQLTSKVTRSPRSLAGYFYQLEPGTLVYYVKECESGSVIVSTIENPAHRIPSEDLFEVKQSQISLA